MTQEEINELEQGNIQALFPNLGMEVYAQGCLCGIIAVTPYQVQVIILEAHNKSYQVNSKIWVDSFLIKKK